MIDINAFYSFRVVEASDLSVRQTLREIGICRSTFYDWYARYLEDGVDGLAPRKRRRARQWNAVPESVREAVVQLTLERTELSPRELAGVAVKTLRHVPASWPGRRDTVSPGPA